jgi:hypothetical protein
VNDLGALLSARRTYSVLTFATVVATRFTVPSSPPRISELEHASPSMPRCVRHAYGACCCARM